jgi:hypothetical protein
MHQEHRGAGTLIDMMDSQPPAIAIVDLDIPWYERVPIQFVEGAVRCAKDVHGGTLPFAYHRNSRNAGTDEAVVSRVRRRKQEGVPNVSVAKVIEITSTSPGSFEDAIRKGIAKAQMSVDGIRGAWISEHKVELAEDGTIKHFRVDMKLTFVLE